MKFYQLFVSLLLLIATSSSFAAEIQCVATAIKSPGWEDYTVSVDLMDYAAKKSITTLVLTKRTGKLASADTVSQIFDCKKYPMIYFTVQYTPVMWEQNKGKIYTSLHIWDLEHDLLQSKPGTDKLEIKVHFPADFQGVPRLIEGLH